MLFKTARSRIPDRAIADRELKGQQQQHAAPKLLMKKRDGGVPAGIGIQARTDRNGSDQSQKTVQVSDMASGSPNCMAWPHKWHVRMHQEREKEYAAARARIFGSESDSAQTATKQPKPSKAERAPSNVAAGPDGSKG